MINKFSALITTEFLAGLILILGLTGCDKKKGEAIVLEKEHIAAREIQPTPSNGTPASNPEATPEYDKRPISPDEITVGPYVMRPEDRGTSRDPRASSDEQWIVKVRLIESGREFNV